MWDGRETAMRGLVDLNHCGRTDDDICALFD